MKPFAIFLVVLTIGAGTYYALRPQKISMPAPVASEAAPEILVRSTDSANESETAEITIAPLPTPVPPQPTRQEIALRITQAIRQALSSTNDAEREKVFAELLPALIAQDPATAGRLAESWEPGEMRQELLRRVAQGWAEVDATAAITWAASLVDADERKSALTDASIQIGQTDPATAIAFAERFELGNSNGTLENLAQLWAGKDLKAAREWAEKQPAGESREQLFARIAFVQTQTAPEDAVNFIVSQMSSGPAQIEAAISAVHQWGQRDLAAASAWVERFPEGPLRDRAQKELVGLTDYAKPDQVSR